MEIIAGSCSYLLKDEQKSADVLEGEAFEIAADSGFTITVADQPCHYVCSFLS
jgi:uncharacterized protein YaiE (UPF0345 family)